MKKNSGSERLIWRSDGASESLKYGERVTLNA